ncbi:MAG TPA: WD40 repeat domain-containing protein [Solirubrobacteraceae bacterium]|nr:WD40 repeat domain-containing protein [Solirubrobacteraceae bacterium]
MKSILIAAVVALCAALAVPAVAHKGGKGEHHSGHKPDVIALPDGFQPEGITTSKRHTFFVGSRDSGAIYRGNLRTGEGAILVPGASPSVPGDDRAATGLKVDRFGRLFVSGGDSHVIRVYDARSGAEIRTYPIPTSGFINDVIVTKRGAYFTDSNNARLYHIPFGRKGALGELVTIALGGDYVNGAGFNANGIEAARGGKSLIVIKSNTGELFDVDTATGVARRIALDPVAGTDNELDEGDGIMRKGRNLYVVENQDDRVTVVKLSRDLGRARIVEEIDSELFDVPTTIARSGGRNYVVNAKFNSASPATETYEVVKVPKR